MKKTILLLTMIAAVVCFIACGKGEAEAQEEAKAYSETTSIKRIQQDPGTAEFSVWVDPETGVQYIVYCSRYGGGITPRFNADGSLYVD